MIVSGLTAASWALSALTWLKTTDAQIPIRESPLALLGMDFLGIVRNLASSFLGVTAQQSDG